ncbi:MAG TPA: DNA polymerase [Candidatus Paceibacterota bacterium]|nr:DNA polymerase [Candidatus Paceibacterota bacterium]
MAKHKKRAEEKGAKKKLVLLDSHAILHRAYHALPDFSSSKGEPTGALYGLVSILLRLISDSKPDYIVATRDLPGATHRHNLFEEYKGTRAEVDDALIAQLIRAPDVFRAFGIPLYEAEGYEADDCIGTIVHELKRHPEINVVIASGDMDTLQLVSPQVRVYTMRSGINDTVFYDEVAVRERYGFGPENVIDYKALRGDPSDNIPGVKGIGEKTATELIQAFGTLEHIYEVLDSEPEAFKEAGIKPRILGLLQDHRNDAILSKTLAEIKLDAPIDFKLPQREWRLDDNAPSIAALCDELEFRSLKERVQMAVHRGTSSTLVDEGKVPDELDPQVVQETSVALWLLHSDLSAPDVDDILAARHTHDFEKAREGIFKELQNTERLQDVYDTIEHPLIPVVRRMNENGVFLDTGALKALAKEYSAEIGKIAGRIFTHAGHEFNINSPKQLGTVLYDELAIEVVRQKKTSSGARTTREEELVKIKDKHPIIAEILAYRELQKLLSTYIEKLPALVAPDGRLHARFLQAGTTTGRMASEDPNLQNIPIKTEHGRRIREAFAAQKGNAIISIDYSQIELRIAAGLSGDKRLIEIFRSGRDIHTEVASRVFSVSPEHVDREMRRRAKVINFGILYGMGVNALRANLGEGVTRAEAAEYLEQYFKTFAGLRAFIDATVASARERGYTETLFGRRRYFPGFTSSLPSVVAQAERMSMNAPIQGTQADIIKLAMVKADALIEEKKWRQTVKMILQVHDELVFEVEEGEAEAIARTLKSVMEKAAPEERLSVPIVAEASLGPNWGDLQKLATND